MKKIKPWMIMNLFGALAMTPMFVFLVTWLFTGNLIFDADKAARGVIGVLIGVVMFALSDNMKANGAKNDA